MSLVGPCPLVQWFHLLASIRQVYIDKNSAFCMHVMFRWSKPHVATPTLQSVLHLRKFLKSGVVLLDLEVHKKLKSSSKVID